MIDITNPEIHFAIQTVRKASLLVREVQVEMVSSALTKEDRSPVTVADYAAQALVGRLLKDAFPQDAVVAEEDSNALQAPGAESTLEAVTGFVREVASEATRERVCAWIDHGRADQAARFWTLDPIDGTKGFLRGDQYALALALVVEGQVQVGVLGCPNLREGYVPDLEGPGTLVIAARGQGSWWTELGNGQHFERLQVSRRAQPSEARILRSFESGHTNVSQIDLFTQAVGTEREPVRMDSQAKYAVLAAGKGDLLLRLLSKEKPNYREKIWDQAAGSIILEEAGGRITDLDGKPLDFTTGRSLLHNRGILASNGQLHAAALDALRAIDA